MAIKDDMEDVQEAVINELITENGITNTLADGQVTETKILNNAVTTNKIANGAVTAVKLGSDVNLTPADGSITPAKLDRAYLETTATGVDVTGTANVYVLTQTNGAGTLTLKDLGGSSNEIEASGTLHIDFQGSNFEINTNDTARFNISSGGDISFYEDTGTTAKLFWDASAESLGIGGSPNDKIDISGSTGDGYRLTDGTHTAVFRSISGGAILKTASNHALLLGANDTERMRIDSSGNVLVGTTNTSVANQTGTTQGVRIAGANNIQVASTGVAAYFNKLSGDGSIVEFRKSAVPVGSISVTSSSTSYNTSSDYRLKENVVDLTGATERLKQLEPKRFNFIADADTTVDGFLAHEVSSIVPEAVTGTKDEVDADGNPEYQGIDQSKLVPLLVATIKELEARITTLEQQ